MSFTTTKIVDQFGNYYIDEGQNIKRVLQMVRQKTVTTTHARPVFTDNTVYRFATTKFGSVVQQFQKKFTAKGEVEFRPNEIPLRQMKVDESFYPDDIEGSWLGFLAGKEIAERKDWPIVRYMTEEYILGQVPHDMEMKVYGKGKFVEPTDGQPGSPEQSLDGMITLCDAGILNTEQPMNKVLLTGTISVTNAVDQLEAFVDNVDRLVRDNFKIKLFADPKLVDDYKKNYRKLFSGDPRYTDEKAGTIDFNTNIELVALPSLSETGALVATPEDNFVHIRRTKKNNPPVIESAKREVNIMLDWWESLGFGYNEMVWYYKPTV